MANQFIPQCVSLRWFDRPSNYSSLDTGAIFGTRPGGHAISAGGRYRPEPLDPAFRIEPVRTVRFTVAGGTSFRGDFVMVFSAPAIMTVRITSPVSCESPARRAGLSAGKPSARTAQIVADSGGDDVCSVTLAAFGWPPVAGC